MSALRCRSGGSSVSPARHQGRVTVARITVTSKMTNRGTSGDGGAGESSSGARLIRQSNDGAWWSCSSTREDVEDQRRLAVVRRSAAPSAASRSVWSRPLRTSDNEVPRSSWGATLRSDRSAMMSAMWPRSAPPRSSGDVRDRQRCLTPDTPHGDRQSSFRAETRRTSVQGSCER